MPAIIEGPPEPGEPRPPLGQRLLWFVGLGAAGLALTGGVAYGLRALLFG